MIEIEFSNQQTNLVIDQERISAAVRAVLEAEKIRSAEISIAVVDDPTIHQLNVRYLEHDYATDVLSFVLSAEEDDHLEGEVIVSADTAISSAESYAWSAADELLLYVIHGMLHLVGYDDHSDQQRETMRSREQHYLTQFGLPAKNRETVASVSPPSSENGRDSA